MSEAAPATCPRCRQPVTGRGALCRQCAASEILSGEAADDGEDWLADLPRDHAEGGRRLGRYELIEEIGGGGMGVVWRARQEHPARLVALKVLRAGESASPARRARFHAEAEAISSLDHPHILPVYEATEADGESFIAMKWAEGGSLAQHMARFAGKPREAAQLVEALAGAVGHAHRRGLLHRDLKPANILLDADQRPFVADFGIAKWLGRESAATVLESALGTPAYMSPEQAAGGRGELTVATDIYSLGAILYEILVQRPPFSGATPLETMQRVANDSPIPPRLLRPEVPRDLETICLKCLARVPAQRYATAEDLAADLRRWQEGEPIAARPVGPAERLWLWVQRNRLVAALAGVLLAVLLSVAIGSTLALQRLRRAEADRIEQLRAALLARAEVNQLSGRTGQRFASLEALAQAARLRPGADLRDAALLALALPDARPAGSPILRHAGNSPAAFDSALGRVVVESEAGVLSLCAVSNGAELRRYESPPGRPRVLYIAPLSADDRRFAARFADHRVRVYALDRPEPLFELTERPACQIHAAFAYDFGFTPDGRELAVGLPGGGLSLHDAADGRETGRLEFVFAPALISFSPDGLSVAVAGLRGTRLEIIERSSGRGTGSLALPATVLHGAWRPDGGELAVACFDNSIYLWPPTAEAARVVLRGHVAAPALVAWSADGHWLASSARDATVRLWDATEGAASLVLPGVIGEPCLRFGHGRLAHGSESRALGVLELGLNDVRQEALRTQAGDYFTVRACLDASRDGRLLVSAARSGLRLFDQASGRQLALLAEPPGLERTVRFTPASDALVYSIEGTGTWRRALRWAAPDRLEVGRPEQVDARPEFFVLDVAGQPPVVALAADSPPTVSIVPLAGSGPRRDLALHGEPLCSLSMDGRFVATASREGAEAAAADVYVWEVATGREVRRLGLGRNGTVRFSPDGAWLWASGGDRIACFAWPSLEPRLSASQSGFDFFFAPDRSLIAVADEDRIRLLRASDGQVLGHLPGAQLIAAAFSADGRRLFQYMNYRLHVWDLPAVRRELAALGLDWAAPPYLPVGQEVPPFTVQVQD